MAYNGLKVLDSDMHCMEPADLWERYIDDAYKPFAPRGLQEYIYMGDDNIVFSTDWPHGDSKYPHAVASFMQLPIAEDSKRKILWDNCARYYQIPPD